MPRIYLSIGSNIDRERSVKLAVEQLRKIFGELTISTVYESEAVGFDGDAFYNLVVGFDSESGLNDIQQQLRTIETNNGRERGAEKFNPRTLDLDLLLYGDLDLQDQGVDIPRAEIFEYAFVLKPLAEIASGECHPQTGEEYGVIWNKFDRSIQPLWPAPLQF